MKFPSQKLAALAATSFLNLACVGSLTVQDEHEDIYEGNEIERATSMNAVEHKDTVREKVAVILTEQRPKGDLDVFREDIASQDKDGQVRAEEEKLQNNAELGDGRKYVVIGDSVANGMHLSYSVGRRPGFIGKDGMTTMGVLYKLDINQYVVRNKEKVIIYCGANNIFSTPPDVIVDHMIKMAKICHEAGVPEIIVNTQLPPDPRWVLALGSRYEEFRQRNIEYRDALLKSFEDGKFPEGARVVDLFTPFADEEGKLKEGYVNRKSSDYLHPWLVYKPALHLMLGSEKDESKAQGGESEQVYPE